MFPDLNFNLTVWLLFSTDWIVDKTIPKLEQAGIIIFQENSRRAAWKSDGGFAQYIADKMTENEKI